MAIAPAATSVRHDAHQPRSQARAATMAIEQTADIAIILSARAHR
jgi:hypothetical protein